MSVADKYILNHIKLSATFSQKVKLQGLMAKTKGLRSD